MKRVREREAQKKAAEEENHIQMDRRVRFTDDDDEAFAFNQVEIEEGKIGQKVQAFCEEHKEKDLAKVLLIDSGSTVDLIQD